MIEPELAIIQRAFPEAQALLPFVPAQNLGRILTGWHDTALSRWTGPAALALRGSALEEYVGETLVVSTDRGRISVYVVGASGQLLTDLSLARRAFLAVAPLAAETTECEVSLT